MKTIYIISILLLTMGFSVKGQYTVETPWGSTVNVTYVAPQNELDLQSRLYWDSVRKDAYPQAIFQPTWPVTGYPNLSSTNRFNCHGYAWHMYWLGEDIEDQLDEPYNMTLAEAENYFNDPSFTKCIQSEADIWWINGGAHSALATDVSTKLKSKWDIGPLATHLINDQPYEPVMEYTTFYKLCYQEYSLNFVVDETRSECAAQFENSSTSNNVDLEIEYEKAVRFIGTFNTGTGSTLYIHPD